MFNVTKPTPSKLTENALASFDKAIKDLQSAQEQIKVQQDEHAATIAQATAAHADAQANIDRLQRVQGRVSDLLA